MEFDEVREILQPLSHSMMEKSESNKEDRDRWNSEVREHLDERNEVNRQVKELINEVQAQKSVRDEINSRVKELKDIRAEKSNHLKSVREELRSKLAEQEETGTKSKRNRGPPPGKIRSDMEKLEMSHMTGRFSGGERAFMRKMKEFREALKEAEKERGNGGMRGLKDSVRAAESSQEEAHKSVEISVRRAQEAHDLMVELSEEVDRLREKANSAHGELNKSKREADALHSQYIVSLRCIHSIDDMMKAMESREKKSGSGEGEEKLEVTDLMSRLMSGDTLSTDELMALRRN
ncbi:MAG: hypothetical protein CMB68_04370 [Euryarchaeota archaeon]|nr:hypothetical protein [Euryarchaeota archaeon]